MTDDTALLPMPENREFWKFSEAEKLCAWEEIREILIKFFGGWHKVNEWLATANPSLGNVSPNDMILAGKTHKLLEWMKKQIAFNSEIEKETGK